MTGRARRAPEPRLKSRRRREDATFSFQIVKLLGRFPVKLPDDPGHAGLRPAARAAVVMPAMFAIAVYEIRDLQLTPFVAFGCFAFLVMADFGGLRPQRALAYVGTAVTGAALISLGTLASSSIWIAVPAMFVVGFSVQFAAVFGGYAAASITALLLSFVLSVSIPAPAGAIGLGSRDGFWLLWRQPWHRYSCGRGSNGWICVARPPMPWTSWRSSSRR